MNSQNENQVLLEAEEWHHLIEKNATVSRLTSARISKVPPAMRRKDKDHYVPKVVSIGPYYSGDVDLSQGESLKTNCIMRLLSKEETGKDLYKKLREPAMVQQLRGFYEDKSTEKFSDKEFTGMMLRDGCFILYYIKNFDPRFLFAKLKLNGQDLDFINQDLLLLENQIPFIVLKEVANIITEIRVGKLKDFIYSFFDSLNILETGDRDPSFKNGGEALPYDHLLHCWHAALTRTSSRPPSDRYSKVITSRPAAIRTINELMEAGIHFKRSEAKTLSHIEFFRGWWSFSAVLQLSPITVEDSTKTILLNLLAYEMSSGAGAPLVVTSYIRVLRYLINQREDVEALREAGVLHHYIGSDEEVVKLFKDIGSGLKPDYDSTYLDVISEIGRHYESFKKVNTPFSQLKRQYFKSPWTFLALMGAILALILSGVQTYFTVSSPKGECDDLCINLKVNHHL